MTKFAHDEFAKEYLSEICQDYGKIIPSAQIKSEQRSVDILFTPDKVVPTSSETLGLLGKVLQTTCLIEIFRNAAQSEQIRECVNKLFDFRFSKIREGKREKKDKKNLDLPFLWIITPTISDAILEEFGATRRDGWDKGIYFTSKGFMTGIIAVHQLEVSRETLWLRLLGKGNVQAKAVEELKSLPENYPKREIVLELIYGLFETLRTNQQKSEQLEAVDLEVIMSLRAIFQERLAQEKQIGAQEGIQQGIQQTLKDNIISLLEKRFQTIPSDLINLINGISDVTQLQELLLETISVNSLEEFQQLIISLDN